ncbi:sugar phosphate isomerase/epimerase family protein [Ramlibacter sp. MMS24-I3-19]|uniref:sugar phosphate isomerase/epimerase family protein n=1 Tax=Ramlibacter sp. MMS24-I3-19 TaxID=3416606 RepID=UPI003D07C0AB
MVPQRIVSVSTAPYDGYELAQALDSIAASEATHADPAFLSGAASADDAAFDAGRGRRVARSLRDAGLDAHAVYTEMDLGGPDALRQLQRRIDFAAAAGARLLVIPAPLRADHRRALGHLQDLGARAEQPPVHVLLTPSLAAGAQALPDAAALVERCALPWVGLSFSTLQATVAQPGLSAADQLDALHPECRHLQLADARHADGWFCVVPGQGSANCGAVLRARSARVLPVSLHLPLRLHRTRTGEIRRSPYRVPLADIEAAVAAGLAFISSIH